MDIDQGKLLRGLPITVNGIGVLKPITVDEIIYIGEKKFYRYLNNLCFDIDDLLQNKDDLKKVNDNVTPFQLIMSECFYDLQYRKLVIEALKFFFKDDVCFIKSYGIFFLGNFHESRFISEKNFTDIVQILKLQNGLLKNDIIDENPKDERTKLLLEKRRKIREKLAKAKARENGEDDTIPLNFADLISIMCSNANGVNHENVWNMNIYLFQDQFQRLKLIEEYDIGIRSLLAGASPDEIDIKHYMSHL